MYNFISQGSDTTCFPVALVNCGIYCGVQLNLQHLIELGHCDTGGCINPRKLVDYSELPLKKTKNLDLVCKNGGIITIMHPIVNLHAVFIYPMTIGMIHHGIMMINSWLAPNEFLVTEATLRRFIAKKPNNNFYYIKI